MLLVLSFHACLPALEQGSISGSPRGPEIEGNMHWKQTMALDYTSQHCRAQGLYSQGNKGTFYSK